jgi:hypothetical protein
MPVSIIDDGAWFSRWVNECAEGAVAHLHLHVWCEGKWVWYRVRRWDFFYLGPRELNSQSWLVPTAKAFDTSDCAITFNKPCGNWWRRSGQKSWYPGGKVFRGTLGRTKRRQPMRHQHEPKGMDGLWLLVEWVIWEVYVRSRNRLAHSTDISKIIDRPRRSAPYGRNLAV